MSEYRYNLTRDLGEGRDAVLVWVMLNPSTADETLDDPTIRRVKSFTAREGYRKLEVVNLFALRSTDPGGLLSHPDPRGPDNKLAIRGALGRAGGIVLAWGSWWDTQSRRSRGGGLPRLNVEGMAGEYGLTPMCLGKTLAGQPRHPLYVKGDTPLEVY
jgi:hypothetical protein